MSWWCRAARPVACQTSEMVRGPGQTTQAIDEDCWKVWKTSGRKQGQALYQGAQRRDKLVHGTGLLPGS